PLSQRLRPAATSQRLAGLRKVAHQTLPADWIASPPVPDGRQPRDCRQNTTPKIRLLTSSATLSGLRPLRCATGGAVRTMDVAAVRAAHQRAFAFRARRQ